MMCDIRVNTVGFKLSAILAGFGFWTHSCCALKRYTFLYIDRVWSSTMLVWIVWRFEGGRESTHTVFADHKGSSPLLLGVLLGV